MVTSNVARNVNPHKEVMLIEKKPDHCECFQLNRCLLKHRNNP